MTGATVPESVRAATAAMVADFDARTRAGLAPLIEADHEAAIAEDVIRTRYPRLIKGDRIERAEYVDYLCMMSDHGCECVALGFVEWMRARA